MAIDQTIRIQDLPVADFLRDDNLIIINDSEDITKSITFENFIGSINEFPGGIVIPPMPDFPGISFCPEDNPQCYTGIGSPGNCQIDIWVCGEVVVEIGPGNEVDIIGSLNIANNLNVVGESNLLGDVNIGSGCGETTLNINSETYMFCDLDVDGNVVIGENCLNTLDVNANSTFNCGVTINDDLTLNGNLILNGELSGNLSLTLENLVILGDLTVGSECEDNFIINATTQANCDVNVGDGIKMTALDGKIEANYFEGDGSLLRNLYLPGSVRFLGTIDVGQPAPEDPENGDLYINTVEITWHYTFSAIGKVFVNQFVFFTTKSGWETGSIQDGTGFVTISTGQTITGEKVFTAKPMVPSTLVTDPGNTAVSLDYVNNVFLTTDIWRRDADTKLISPKTIGDSVYASTVKSDNFDMAALPLLP